MGNVSVLGLFVFFAMPIAGHCFFVFKFFLGLKKIGLKKSLFTTLKSFSVTTLVYLLAIVFVKCLNDVRFHQQEQFYTELKSKYTVIDDISIKRALFNDYVYIYLDNEDNIIAVAEDILQIIVDELLCDDNFEYYDNILRNPSCFTAEHDRFFLIFIVYVDDNIVLRLENFDQQYNKFIGRYKEEAITLYVTPLSEWATYS